MPGECRNSTDEIEIEVTPEMVRAGIEAWREEGGDEFPKNSFAHELVVEAIFRAMMVAKITQKVIEADEPSDRVIALPPGISVSEMRQAVLIVEDWEASYGS